jgi:SAM-dependent methyltransferase
MNEHTQADEDAYDMLVHDALEASFGGWDFSYVRGRVVESQLPWDYRAIVEDHLANAGSALDMGTGGGEFLTELSRLPAEMYATEQYVPNVAVARARLEPLGVQVIYLEEETEPPFSRHLPLESGSIDVVINRHESYTPTEVARVLGSGGVFVTQQVGSVDEITLAQFLEQKSVQVGNWNLESAVLELEQAGMKVEYADEHIGTTRFTDVGAVVYFLRAIPWLVEDFSVERYDEQLRRLHARILARGYLESQIHRFVVVARKG